MILQYSIKIKLVNSAKGYNCTWIGIAVEDTSGVKIIAAGYQDGVLRYFSINSYKLNPIKMYNFK